MLLRLAEDLERSRDQLVRGTSLALRNGAVELRLVADGESAVPALGGRARARAVRARVRARAVGGGLRRSKLAARTAARERLSSPRAARVAGAVEQHEPVGVRDGAVPVPRWQLAQARSTALVAALPPRSEYSPPSIT